MVASGRLPPCRITIGQRGRQFARSENVLLQRQIIADFATAAARGKGAPGWRRPL